MITSRNFAMLRQVSTIFGARTIAALIQAAILIVLARALGPSDFGIFVVGLTSGALVGVATGMGSAMQALLLDGRTEHRSVGTTLLGVRIMTALAAAAAAFTVCVTLGLSPLPAIVCGLWSWTEVVIELIQALLLGQGRLRTATFTIVARRVGPGAGLVGWGLLGHSMWTWLLAGLVLASASSLAVCGVLLARPARVGSIVRESRHYWTSTVLSTLQSADVAVVGAFAPGAATVGHYAAAARATSPLNLLTGSVVSVLTPKWAQVEDARKRFASFLRARRGLWGLAITLIVVSPGAAWAAPLVLGNEYAGSSIFFAGVTIAAGVSAVVQGHSAFLFASGAAQRVTSARLLSIPAGLVLVGVAAYLASPVPLALAPVASQALQLAAMSRETKKFMAAAVTNDL